ncbi:MAG: hypothetical protein ACP5U2_03815 [Bryobacteraceae bacterium]
MILLNLSREPYQLRGDDRIAQIVAARYGAVEREEGELNPSTRGPAGLGSSGS